MATYFGYDFAVNVYEESSHLENLRQELYQTHWYQFEKIKNLRNEIAMEIMKS